MKSIFTELFGGLCDVWTLIARFYANLYAWTITIFYVFQGLVIYGMTRGWLEKDVHGNDMNADEMLTASLMIAVYAVVCLNTLIFYKQLSPVLAPISQSKCLDNAERRLAKDYYDTFLMGLWAATIIGAGLALLIYLSIYVYIDPKALSWKDVLRINEMFSIMIFTLFLIADWLGCRVCKIAMENKSFQTSGNAEAVAASLEEMRLAIVAVDLPGLLGLAFIVLVSNFVYPKHIGFSYWHGFVAGAIAFHIAFSQTALALLAARQKHS